MCYCRRSLLPAYISLLLLKEKRRLHMSVRRLVRTKLSTAIILNYNLENKDKRKSEIRQDTFKITLKRNRKKEKKVKNIIKTK